MIATTWAFVLILNLTSSGVDVRAVSTSKTLKECETFRNVVLAQLGGRAGSSKTTPTPEGGIKWEGGSMTKCLPTEPIK